MLQEAAAIPIAPGFVLHPEDVEMAAVRSSGAGGQNVNKVATAIHLRYDLHAARMPAEVRERLLKRRDSRITDDGVVVIKAQNHRTQARNREEALARLVELLRSATVRRKPRRATKPTRGARERRLKKKKISSEIKKMRKKPMID